MNARRLFVNALTFSRVPLIFAWLALAVVQEYRGGFWLGVWATVMMAASGLSDLFDGMLARKWRVVSTLGKMADPLMDKVFYAVAFPALTWQIAHQGESDIHALVMLAFSIFYLLRDLWVTFMRSIGTMFGADVAAMWLGKVRTALSFPCAGWVYMYLAFHRLPGFEASPMWLLSCYVFEALMIGLTMVSIFTYTRSYSVYLRRALEEK